MSTGTRTICKSGRESDGKMGRNIFSFILIYSFICPIDNLHHWHLKTCFFPFQNNAVVEVVKTLEIHLLPLEGREHKSRFWRRTSKYLIIAVFLKCKLFRSWRSSVLNRAASNIDSFGEENAKDFKNWSTLSRSWCWITKNDNRW